MTKIEQLNVTFFDQCFLDVTAERKSGKSNYIKQASLTGPPREKTKIKRAKDGSNFSNSQYINIKLFNMLIML